MSAQSSFYLKLALVVAAFVALFFFMTSKTASVEYSSLTVATTTKTTSSATSSWGNAETTAPEIIITHLPTPHPLYGAYMTSCIASGKNLRAPLTKLVEKTELNALIIDIKDFSGMVSFDTGDSRFVINKNGCVIPDIKEFIAELHQKNIYVIGRVTVMQDSTYTKSHPNAAVKRRSNGETWRDKKGLSFIDPGATEYWQYMIDLGKVSYALGFDEINYDYIRYPSDGDMSDAVYLRSGSSTKSAMMKKFYTFLGRGMRDARIPISADLFGMTTTNTDDLGIGQVLEYALLNFDYVAPMVYPSHYPPNFNGWQNPNMVPYELIKFVMASAVTRANEMEEKESGFVKSSTTPTFSPTGKYKNRLRPWLQDFDYGKDYTEADVRAQIKGTYDAGLASWMMWDPSNKYTPSAYDGAGAENMLSKTAIPEGQPANVVP